jgi:hypothetical protein
MRLYYRAPRRPEQRDRAAIFPQIHQLQQALEFRLEFGLASAILQRDRVN